MDFEKICADIKRRQVAMSEAARMSESASMRYQAHMTLFSVAARSNDPNEMEQHRVTLHNLLDQILDATYEVNSHQKEIDALVINSQR